MVATECWAFDADVIQGQWAAYQETEESGVFYYFLDVNPDLSGTLISYFGHGEPTIRIFNTGDVIKRDGYVEVRFRAGEKAILSGWNKRSSVGKLAGLLLIIGRDGNVINMMYLPLDLLTSDDPMLTHPILRELYDKYR